MQNTADVLERETVAGEFRGTAERRRGWGGDGDSSGETCIFWVEHREAAAAAETEKLKYHSNCQLNQ